MGTHTCFNILMLCVSEASPPSVLASLREERGAVAGAEDKLGGRDGEQSKG